MADKKPDRGRNARLYSNGWRPCAARRQHFCAAVRATSRQALPVEGAAGEAAVRLVGGRERGAMEPGPAGRSALSPSSQDQALCGRCSIRPSTRAASERPSRRGGKSTPSSSRNTIKSKFISTFPNQISNHFAAGRWRKSPPGDQRAKSSTDRINVPTSHSPAALPNQPTACTRPNRSIMNERNRRPHAASGYP